MTISEDIKIPSATQVINNTMAYARKENISVALWKHPGEPGIQLIMDFSDKMIPAHEPLESKIPGFIFAPYDASDNTYLIKAHLHLDLTEQRVKRPRDYTISTKANRFLDYLEAAGDEPSTGSTVEVLTEDTDEEGFKELVRQSIRAIHAGSLQKVVPSRKKEIVFNHPLSLGDNFTRLAASYPDAFVSLVFVPQTGVWLGATPELLISVRDNIFKTVSLAGTQKREEGMSLANVAWTQKEIEEQALVSRYIIECFKKIRLREYQEAGPKSIVAGNLLHLKTEYKVDMQATNFPDLGEIMLKLLHPTSAICGMPLEPARRFLKSNEMYERKYFSGYLGPANLNDITALYVNLRCVHLEDTKATFFAGAGVTEDSQPEKEWRETEIKMNTLLNIIK